MTTSSINYSQKIDGLGQQIDQLITEIKAFHNESPECLSQNANNVSAEKAERFSAQMENFIARVSEIMKKVEQSKTNLSERIIQDSPEITNKTDLIAQKVVQLLQQLTNISP